MSIFLEVGPSFMSGIYAFSEVAASETDNPLIQLQARLLSERYAFLRAAFGPVTADDALPVADADEEINVLAATIANGLIEERFADVPSAADTFEEMLGFYEHIEASVKSGLKVGYLLARDIGVQPITTEVEHG